MNYISYTNDSFFHLIADNGLNFLSDVNYINDNYFSIQNDDILIIKNYFEDERVFESVEKLIENEKLYVVYFPRSIKNKESYAFLTKSKFVYDKLNDYINLYKNKITAIYDFPNYWDPQWRTTIMCERMCEKMMNDTCIKLFDTIIIPYDFIGTVQSGPKIENTLLTQKFLDFSDKIVCSEGVTRILKKMDVKIDPEKIILHPHVWGTSTRYSMDHIEKEYGFKIPYKNMCYMSNIQESLKKENSFLGFYIDKPTELPEKNKDILLWGKDINIVLGKEYVDEKIKLIDNLCEKYTVYTTVNNNDEFDRIKNLMINKHNFINYGILNRRDYLDNMKLFKIFLSLNENVCESLGFVEALSSGCHIISHRGFHSSITQSTDLDLKNFYSIYDAISKIEELVNNIIIKNSYQSKMIDVFKKYNYINRIINIINGHHETAGAIYF